MPGRAVIVRFDKLAFMLVSPAAMRMLSSMRRAGRYRSGEFTAFLVLLPEKSCSAYSVRVEKGWPTLETGSCPPRSAGAAFFQKAVHQCSCALCAHLYVPCMRAWSGCELVQTSHCHAAWKSTAHGSALVALHIRAMRMLTWFGCASLGKARLTPEHAAGLLGCWQCHAPSALMQP